MDAAGAEVTDQSAQMIDTMKLEVLRNDTVAKTYTLVINAEEPTEPTDPVDDNTNDDDSSITTALFIGIGAGVAVVAIDAVFLVIVKKTGKKA